jgi:MoaA/NifB/PqqE/SkfB family radical SAM enzyme
MNENFCYHPWTSLHLSPQGEFKPCTSYRESIAVTYQDYKSSQSLAKLKEEFIQGTKPKGCSYCWEQENQNIISKRQLDRKYTFKEIKINTNDPTLSFLNITFGNSCNLACVTCNSYYSSTWTNEAKKMAEHLPNIKIYKHNNFYKTTNYTDIIDDLSNTITHVEIVGGEPFLAGKPQHIKFLEQLIEKNKNFKLVYTTNVTEFPDDIFWDLWKNFKEVLIRLSVDGIENQFEYVRWPAEWSVVANNIKLYQDKQQEYDNLKLKVMCVNSIFTVYYLPEFLIWCLKNNLDRPFLETLHYPEILDIKNLPTEIKNKITEKLSSYNLNEVVQYMNRESNNKHLFNDTIKFIQGIDETRKLSFDKTFSEFSQLLQEAGCQI